MWSKRFSTHNTLVTKNFRRTWRQLKYKWSNSSKEVLKYFIFLIFFLFTYDRHTVRERGRDTGRGRSRLHAPGARCGTRSWDSRIPEPKAGAKPLSHPGIPIFYFLREREREREREQARRHAKGKGEAGSPLSRELSMGL